MNATRFVFYILLLAAFVAPPVVDARASTAPTFSLRTLGRETFDLSEALKKGPVLVSFWATWCKPCMMELPELQKLYTAMEGQPVSFVAINVDEANYKVEVRNRVKRLGLTLPVALDTSGDLLARYNPAKSLPYTVVVGQDGVIAATHTGYSPGVMETIEAELRRLMPKP